MTGKLSTHCLDLHRGRPAAGLRLRLYRLAPDGNTTLLKEEVTNAEGRTGSPLLQREEMEMGRYELVFEVGAYFAALNVPTARPPFLDQVPIRVGIAEPSADYHVPLLFSPWAYSTYRGS